MVETQIKDDLNTDPKFKRFGINMDLIEPEVPKWSRWCDSKKRLFIVVARLGMVTGDEITSIELLNVEEETVAKISLQAMKMFIEQKSLTRVPKA